MLATAASFSPIAPTLIEGPAAPVVDLATAKAYLRLESDEEDAVMQILVDAATARVDGWSGILGRCLVNQTWACNFPRFPSSLRERLLRLPLAPVSAISSIAYLDAAGAEQTLDPSVYRLLVDAESPFVALAPHASWPATDRSDDAVTITFVAGYGEDGDAVPAPIRRAILTMVNDAYEYRETAVIEFSASFVPVSVSVSDLLAPYRRQGF
jgi:uncharacterized phiE125 gp8 family phage protein